MEKGNQVLYFQLYRKGAYLINNPIFGLYSSIWNFNSSFMIPLKGWACKKRQTSLNL